MAYVSIENLLKSTHGSVYKLVILASKRALELSMGSEKLVEEKPNTKLTSIAFKEIEKDKVRYKDKKDA